jgi:hypothetical protein
MIRGRRPKPTALRRNDGNPGKRGYNALALVQVQFETIRKAMTTAAATQAMVWVCRLR